MATWQMGEVTAASVWDMGSVGAASPTLSIIGVGSGGVVTDGQVGVLVTGQKLDTVTGAFIETSDQVYQSAVTGTFSASSATEATFTHARGDTPFSTASYQLRLRLTDGTNEATFNITVNPAAGEQVIELESPVTITDPESGFAPYTGSDPVAGDQMLMSTTTDTENAPIIPQSDSSLYYDYSAFDPVPSTDVHTIEYFSDGGSGRIWSTTTMTIQEPGGPVPQGTITFGTITETDTTANIPFSYSDTDEDSFEYSLDSGMWTTTTSPIELSGLTASTTYQVRVRAVNASGEGTISTTNVTTDSAPEEPQGFITFGSITVGTTTGSIAFSYNDSDADSFEHSINGGSTWDPVTSPISRTGLTEGVQYSGLIRAVNAQGVGATSSYSFVTLTTIDISSFVGIKRSIKSPIR